MAVSITSQSYQTGTVRSLKQAFDEKKEEPIIKSNL